MPALQLGTTSKQATQTNGLQYGTTNCLDGKQLSPEAETLLLAEKKKRLLLDSQQAEVNNNLDDGEEKFADVYTIGTNGKFVSGDEDQQMDIFRGDDGYETSIGRSAKDQFADALLRLQADLDNATERLGELAAKVDKINSLSIGKQQQQSQEKKNNNTVFNRNNVTTLFYFSWPVVVFLAIRALEKRASTSK